MKAGGNPSRLWVRESPGQVISVLSTLFWKGHNSHTTMSSPKWVLYHWILVILKKNLLKVKIAFKRLGVNINNTFANNFIKISTDARSTFWNYNLKFVCNTSKNKHGLMYKLRIFHLQSLLLGWLIKKNCYLYITPKLLFKIQCCDRAQHWHPGPGWGPISAREFHVDVSVDLGSLNLSLVAFWGKMTLKGSEKLLELAKLNKHCQKKKTKDRETWTGLSGILPISHARPVGIHFALEIQRNTDKHTCTHDSCLFLFFCFYFT